MDTPMIATGSRIQLHFTLQADGDLLGSSAVDGPYDYIQGRDAMPPGLQEGVEGLREGDRKRIVVPPDQAYGRCDPDAMMEIPRADLSGLEPVVAGDRVRIEGDGQEYTATVAEAGEAVVKLDFNHPLAGKTLEYEVQVVRVE